MKPAARMTRLIWTITGRAALCGTAHLRRAAYPGKLLSAHRREDQRLPVASHEGARHLGLCGRFDGAQMLVVMGRVQVEYGQRFDAGGLRQSDPLLPGRMAPSDAG